MNKIDDAINLEVPNESSMSKTTLTESKLNN